MEDYTTDSVTERLLFWEFSHFPMKSFNPDEFLILVVDDVKQNLQVVIAMLEDYGYTTTFATNGEQALERVKFSHPDLILLDLMMPGMNGLQVCKRLKSDPDTQDILVIFLTASQEDSHLMKAFELGAVDYINKPFKAPELLARVQTHLDLKHTRDELREALEKQDKLVQDLHKLATTDALTGIPNRRQIWDWGKQELERAYRYQRPLSLFVLDVDHFKEINDTYGHSAGDRALKAMTEVVMETLRTSDRFGRFGGEEFVGILPETDLAEGIQVAERVRKMIADLSVELTEEKRVQFTVSIGITSYHEKNADSNLEDLLRQADRSLYEAKQQGRDRVVAFSELN